VYAAHLALDSINIFHSSTAPQPGLREPSTHTSQNIYTQATGSFVRSFVRNKVGKVFPPNSIPVCTPSLFDKVPFNGRQRTNKAIILFFLFILFFLGCYQKLVYSRERERLISRQMEGSEQEMGIPCFLSSSVADRSIPDDVAGAVARQIVATFPSVCFACRPYEGKEKEDDNTFWLFATSHHSAEIRNKVNEEFVSILSSKMVGFQI
jgi:hypothetical protein